MLNGKPLLKQWFTQKDIKKGRNLELHLDPIPNKDWGRSSNDAPSPMGSSSK